MTKTKLDADVVNARFEADGRLTVVIAATAGATDATLRAVHLSVHGATDDTVLATESGPEVNAVLTAGARWEEAITFPLGVSAAARKAGRAMVVLEPAEGDPIGVRFDFAPTRPIEERKKKGDRARSLLPFFVGLAVLGALVVASRAC